MLAPPILPARYQASIFSADELNFRVRNGNGCTLTAVGTNFFTFQRLKHTGKACFDALTKSAFMTRFKEC